MRIAPPPKEARRTGDGGCNRVTAMRARSNSILTSMLLAVLLPTGLAPAQVHVNTQVNNGVNNWPYFGGTTGPVNYPRQIELLPSEVRFAEIRSGALPSELRMNEAAIGPLAPQGPLAFIPRETAVQRWMRLPAPQLYNPAYNLTAALGQRATTAPPAGAAALSAFYPPTAASVSSTPLSGLSYLPAFSHSISVVRNPAPEAESEGQAAPPRSAPAPTGGGIIYSSLNPPGQ